MYAANEEVLRDITSTHDTALSFQTWEALHITNSLPAHTPAVAPITAPNYVQWFPIYLGVENLQPYDPRVAAW